MVTKQNRHCDNFVFVCQTDTTDTNRITAGKYADIGHTETNAFTLTGGQQDIVIIGTGLNRDQFVATIFFKLHGDFAV